MPSSPFSSSPRSSPLRHPQARRKPLPRPAACSREVGYGQGLEVPAGGEAGFVCAGDTALDPTASSLAYGTASRFGGSECISRSDGITCVNRAGHGFFISVQSYQVF